MVLRLLAVADARLCDWNRRDLGDYAQMGLRLLDGMDEGAARAAVEMRLDKPADFVFDQLLRALPDGLKARDRHGIVAKLEQLGLCPLAAQNVEHMLCEFRKLVLVAGRHSKATASSGKPSRQLFSAVCERRVSAAGRAPQTGTVTVSHRSPCGYARLQASKRLRNASLLRTQLSSECGVSPRLLAVYSALTDHVCEGALGK